MIAFIFSCVKLRMTEAMTVEIKQTFQLTSAGIILHAHLCVSTANSHYSKCVYIVEPGGALHLPYCLLDYAGVFYIKRRIRIKVLNIPLTKLNRCRKKKKKNSWVQFIYVYSASR